MPFKCSVENVPRQSYVISLSHGFWVQVLQVRPNILILVLVIMVHIHEFLFSTTHSMTHNMHTTIIGPGGPEFAAFKDKTAAEHGVQFHTSLSAVPPVADGVKRLALISGRTVDNPKLLTESIAAGCTVIYLEKPGTLVCIIVIYVIST